MPYVYLGGIILWWWLWVGCILFARAGPGRRAVLWVVGPPVAVVTGSIFGGFALGMGLLALGGLKALAEAG